MLLKRRVLFNNSKEEQLLPELQNAQNQLNAVREKMHGIRIKIKAKEKQLKLLVNRR